MIASEIAMTAFGVNHVGSERPKVGRIADRLLLGFYDPQVVVQIALRDHRKRTLIHVGPARPQGPSFKSRRTTCLNKAASSFLRLDRVACGADVKRMTGPRAATLSLLARRTADATICPSEVARAIAPDWRDAMPAVHAAIDGLVRDGLVRLSWKGRPLAKRSGPYRIGRLGDD